LGTCQKPKTGSHTKDLQISSYSTDKNKDLLPPQDPRRQRHTHRNYWGIGRSLMTRDLVSHLLTLYTFSLPFFPVSACPCFYSFLYTLYSEILLFPPPDTISLPSFSYFLYPCFIDWIADFHLQDTLSDFTLEEIYSFSNILFALL
jgi:hypothetical protein